MKKILFIAIATIFSLGAMAAKSNTTKVAKAKEAATVPVTKTKKADLCLTVVYSDGLSVTACCSGCSSITITRFY